MKTIWKKVLIYLAFVAVSILFFIGGSEGIANLLTKRYENIISNEISKPEVLQKCSSDRRTYNSLKNLSHPKIKALAGDQGANNIIGLPVRINGHDYDVSLKTQSNNWNEYYVRAKLQSIKREN